MNRALAVTMTQLKATVPAGVFRLVFDQVAASHAASHLSHTDHSVGPGHLANGVGEKEYFFAAQARDDSVALLSMFDDSRQDVSGTDSLTYQSNSRRSTLARSRPTATNGRYHRSGHFTSL